MLWTLLKFIVGIFALCSIAATAFFLICLIPESDAKKDRLK